MRSSTGIRSIAAAAAVLLALAACAPAPDEPGVAPSVSETSTAAETPGAGGADEAEADADASPVPDEEDAALEAPSGPTGDDDPPPAAPTASTPPAAAMPTVSVLSQQCTSGKLTVTLTAAYDNSYRKGIGSVVLERQNEYDAWLDADATWLGPETGQGNQWTGNPPGHKNQRFQDDLRIIVTASGGAETVLIVPITANC
jgi:hypothetical protein